MSSSLPVPQPSEPAWERFTADPRRPRNKDVRVGHSDRDLVADLLGDAYALGKLDNDEYNERLDKAMQIKTVGEISPLVGDLVTGSAPARRDGSRGRIIASRILLLIAGTVVGINVLIWLLASLSAGALLYFWPMWVAVGMVIPVVIAFALGRSDD